MHSTRKSLLVLVTAAAVAAPLPAAAAAIDPTTVTTAKIAKPKPRPKVTVKNLIDTTDETPTFSPNGDKVRDRVRVPYTLKRKSVVTVKVLRVRNGKSPKVLITDKLGKVPRGKHAFRWDGRKRSGKVAQDRRYQVTLFADPVKKHLTKATDSTSVEVDTRYTPRQLQASATTVYPNTTVFTDRIGFNHNGPPAEDDAAWERVRKVTLVVTGATGEVVRSSPQPYPHDYSKPYPVTWDGRNDNGVPVPAGSYTVRMKVTDMAGNTGTSPGLVVHVAAAPLVVASGTRTVAPVSGTLPPAPTSPAATTRDDGRASTNGGDDAPWEPCGSVFASAVYPAAGASFRSRAACGWALDEARGSGSLPLTELNAPRGLKSVRVSMRGRPTIDGEIDTAQIALGSSAAGGTTSQAVPAEVVTSTPVRESTWDAAAGHRSTVVTWTIRTVGFDAYDVADVTVDFTYLTPQGS